MPSGTSPQRISGFLGVTGKFLLAPHQGFSTSAVLAFGATPFHCGDSPVLCRAFRIPVEQPPGFDPRDVSSTRLPSHDHQHCHQTLPRVPWGAVLSPLRCLGDSHLCSSSQLRCHPQGNMTCMGHVLWLSLS